jgi:hypothetical protein
MSPTKKSGSRRRRPAPIAELVVKRGALRRFDKLKQATAELPVTVSWDRRTGERRASGDGPPDERRKSDRRQKPPFTWESADFVVVAPKRAG